MAPNYITEVVFNGDWVKRLHGRTSVKFKPGTNILIGPNGSGKSTILTVINQKRSFTKEKEIEIKLKNQQRFEFYYFDFEKQNPRSASKLFEDGGGYFQLASHFLSHGETVKHLHEFLLDSKVKGCLTLLDEPEQALDLDGVDVLMSYLQKTEATQVIIATHAMSLILNPEYNVIELEENYCKKVYTHAERAIKKFEQTRCNKR